MGAQTLKDLIGHLLANRKPGDGWGGAASLDQCKSRGGKKSSHLGTY